MLCPEIFRRLKKSGYLYNNDLKKAIGSIRPILKLKGKGKSVFMKILDFYSLGVQRHSLETRLKSKITPSLLRIRRLVAKPCP